jgi:hypothetical protein
MWRLFMYLTMKTCRSYGKCSFSLYWKSFTHKGEEPLCAIQYTYHILVIPMLQRIRDVYPGSGSQNFCHLRSYIKGSDTKYNLLFRLAPTILGARLNCSPPGGGKNALDLDPGPGFTTLPGTVTKYIIIPS